MSILRFLPDFINSKLNDNNEEHSAVIGSIENSIETIEEDIEKMYQEVSFVDSTGFWLDKWAEKFNISREANETDIMLFNKIVSSIGSPKITVPAMQEFIAKYLNAILGEEIYAANNISAFEPWNCIGEFSGGRGGFSTKCRFPDGKYWDRCTIDFSIPEPLRSSLDVLRTLLNRIKAGGVKIFFTCHDIAMEVVDSPIKLPNSIEFGFIVDEPDASCSISRVMLKFSTAKDIDFNTIDPFSSVYTLEQIEPYLSNYSVIYLMTGVVYIPLVGSLEITQQA